MRATDDRIKYEQTIAKIPPGVDRVLVITEKGEQKYKAIADISVTDDIQFAKNGDPIVMRVKPGRPKKAPTIAPVTPAVKELVKHKHIALEKDPVLCAVKQDLDSPEVIRQVMLALGEEAASLKFERVEAERVGADTSGFSLRRVNALKAFIETWLKRREQAGVKDINPKTPAGQALVRFIAQTYKEAMEALGLRDEMIKTIFSKVAAAMDSDDWANELRNRMKNAG